MYTSSSGCPATTNSNAGTNHCQDYQTDRLTSRRPSKLLQGHQQEEPPKVPQAVPLEAHLSLARSAMGPLLANSLAYQDRGPSLRGSSVVFSSQSPSYLAGTHKNKVNERKWHKKNENKYKCRSPPGHIAADGLD